MTIRVRSQSEIAGSSEHVVTEEGLRAAGVDPRATDPRLVKIRSLQEFLLWVQEAGYDDLSVMAESDTFAIAEQYVDQL